MTDTEKLMRLCELLQYWMDEYHWPKDVYTEIEEIVVSVLIKNEGRKK